MPDHPQVPPTSVILRLRHDNPSVFKRDGQRVAPIRRYWLLPGEVPIGQSGPREQPAKRAGARPLGKVSDPANRNEEIQRLLVIGDAADEMLQAKVAAKEAQLGVGVRVVTAAADAPFVEEPRGERLG
jgi:hypothetical protein